MVKNTIGGKKGKMMANKNGGGGLKKEQIRLIEFPGIEVFVCVTKVFGGGLFEVMDNDSNKYTAYLRGKMKGHNKRHNLVALFSILLVALRIDTDPTKCDILFVYDSHDIQFLALNPTLNIANLLSIHSNQILNSNSISISNHTNTDLNVLFSTDHNADLNINTNLNTEHGEHIQLGELDFNSI
jgi:hypothetical protein